MSEYDITIAVDPGKMTGYAFHGWPEQHAPPMAGELPWREFARYSLDWAKGVGQMRDSYDLTFVCESFIITQATIRKSRENWSLEMIGFLKGISYYYLDKEIVLQTPAQAKRFSTDEKLKKLDWYRPGKDHANDALRHMMLYMVNRNVLPPAMLLQ